MTPQTFNGVPLSGPHYATEPQTREALQGRILHQMGPLVTALLDLNLADVPAKALNPATMLSAAASVEALEGFTYDAIQNLYAPNPDAYGIRQEATGPDGSPMAELVRGSGAVVWRQAEDAEFVPLAEQPGADVDALDGSEWPHLIAYLRAKGHLPRYVGAAEVVDLDAEEFETQPRDVLEWWLVERGLFEILRERGLVVLEAGRLTLWGRTTSGQVWSQDDELRALVGSWQQREAQRGYAEQQRAKGATITAQDEQPSA